MFHSRFTRLAIFTLCLALALAPGRPVRGQQTELEDPVVQAWGQLASMNKCASCHYRGTEPNPLAPHSGEFSKQSEAKHWVRKDKHAIARRRVEPLTRQQLNEELRLLREGGLNNDEVLQWLGRSNMLSRQICDQLGYDVTTDLGYARFRENCLRCHGGYSETSQDRQFSKTKPGRFQADAQQPGISCNYCHQLGNEAAWIDEHDSPDNWRLLSPQKKSQRGMRDLIALDAQAALCCDCHMGNISQNKFVTHAMYAAGHPPLPSFELQTFCEFMPQHWRTPGQLYQALENFNERDQYFETNYPWQFGGGEHGSHPDDEFWKTRKVITGALQARQRSLELLVQAAETNRWGDYAFYDCAACHHELRVDSRRQQVGFPGVPGRPRQPIWPQALADVVIGGVDANAAVASMQRELVKAFDQQPFGDPLLCASLARRVIGELQQSQNALASRPIEVRRAREFLLALSHVPPSRLVDYHSARQVIWAMQQVSAELRAMNALLPKPVEELLSDSEDDVVDGISTRLPAGRELFIYPKYLDQELRRRGDYALDDLAKRLDRIRELLERE